MFASGDEHMAVEGVVVLMYVVATFYFLLGIYNATLIWRDRWHRDIYAVICAGCLLISGGLVWIARLILRDLGS